MMHHALGAYLRTRWIAARYRDRASFERWQRATLTRWVAEVPGTVRFFRPHAGAGRTLADLPITDKDTVMADFGAFNSAGIDADAAWRALDGDGRVGPYTVGASTGTSGNRGLFVVSDRERFTWLGILLAKALPAIWRRPERVALVLPRNSRLYDSARRTSRIALRYFDLTDDPARWMPDLAGFAPTVVVGPPRALRLIGDAVPDLTPRTLFSAGESLDPSDKAAIEARFGGPLRQIYMATEGLFAVSCRFGTLHLAEDAVHFEWEETGDGLKVPVVTDFVRRTQVLARYRMNDLVRLSPGRCPCGSPLQAVAEVVGRLDDVVRLPRASGGFAAIMPDALRNAIVDSHRAIADFRLVQTGADTIDLALPSGTPADASAAAETALRAVFSRHGANPELLLRLAELTFEPGRKLRRVENRWGGRNG